MVTTLPPTLAKNGNSLTQRTAKVLKRLGYIVIGLGVVTVVQDADPVKVLKKGLRMPANPSRNGSIVGLDDTKEVSKSLSKVIKYIQKKGFNVATAPECFGDGGPVYF
jgi:hypothetical protein